MIKCQSDLVAVQRFLTQIPPSISDKILFEDDDEKHDSPFEFTFEDHFEESYLTNNNLDNMAGTGSPFVKPEATDFFNMNQFSPNHRGEGFDMMNNNGFGSINPNQLGQSINNGHGFGQNSFNMGNSGIADDELADLAGTLDNNGQVNLAQHDFYGNNNNNAAISGSLPIAMTHTNMNNIYSSTPDGAPIHSPFLNNDGFNYAQFSDHQGRPLSMTAQSSGFSNQLLRAQHMQAMERKTSQNRIPASPQTPGINNLHLGDAEYSSPALQQRQLMNHLSTSVPTNSWDITPSAHSWNEGSPFPSPSSAGHNMQHPQIAEVLRSDKEIKVGSPSIKTEPGTGTGQTVEAKRRRRRESHNLVERRRRDNINERIQDLAHLVPQHRLEDEKVRKHILANTPLSPTITAENMSPPNSTILGTSANRRAGVITQGLPIDDKDKGPNKGDILNSSVSWTRDVVWYLKVKMQQEEQLKELCRSRGIEWPFPNPSEDERRMRSEIDEVVERNTRSNNILPYTRTAGTGLRVPGFTNMAGDSLADGAVAAEPSPNFQTFGAMQNWSHYADNPVFKEEDELDEDML